MPASAPTGTYRLQLRSQFGFGDAQHVLGYLDALGISHAYLSPVLQAAPGSTHGYDVIDHDHLSEDLGGASAFHDLAGEAARRGMGIVVDVVPNHMAVPTPAYLNAALWSVLKDGPTSPYAHWFDVDWAAQERAILMPVLGRRIGECVRDGEITTEEYDGEPRLRYFDHVFPIRPGTAGLPLAELLDRQFYRLAHWRVGDEELNYRRFFDIDTLVGVRVEDERVFAETHAVLLALVSEGHIQGLRIDHPDGLADPRGYVMRLYGATGAWIVVEKILEGDEQLPDDWPCAGTTGYDALLRVGGLFADPDGGPVLTRLYGQLTGEPVEFDSVVEEAKRWVVEHGLQAEVHRLVEVAAAICHDHLDLRDHTHRALHEALVELLVAFPVYRAYVVPGEPPSTQARAVLEAALATARSRLPEERQDTLAVVGQLALGERGRGPNRDDFVVRFQQTCGPVMAKGVEDTAFYRWWRLSALNEVGGDPAHLGVTPVDFHDWCGQQQRSWPSAMTTLSTHDTKRSEDVRARLMCLTEVADDWGREVAGWRAHASAYKPAELDANTEYLLWQTLVGAWPLTAGRLTGYLEKATREAKRHTTWTEPVAPYDDAVRDFALQVLDDRELTAQIAAFVDQLAPLFRVQVLGQKLVQLTMPGVPDIYQGSETVDLSLVDPDNRRPVDYAARGKRLAELDTGKLPADLDDEKLLVVSRALRVRREHPDWFGADASYEPIRTSSEHGVAYARGGRAITVVTRLAATLERAGGWGDPTVTLPSGQWRDVLTGEEHAGGEVSLSHLLDRLPVALLTQAP
jgi:(1->4)-alpha-D-glucan 1-alpha-D-glucosylmutase